MPWGSQYSGSVKVNSQEAAKSSTVTEGHRKSHHSKEQKQNYTKLCKINRIFSTTN